MALRKDGGWAQDYKTGTSNYVQKPKYRKQVVKPLNTGHVNTEFIRVLEVPYGI